MIEVRDAFRLIAVLASIATAFSCVAHAGGRDPGPSELRLKPEHRIQVRSGIAGPGWHEAGIGRLSLPISGDECTRISVDAGGGGAGTGEVLLLTLEAVDSVRVHGADDARWRTVASDRVRLPEPRC